VTIQKSAKRSGAFLAPFAALLLDNVARLEETVGRVTDLVMGYGRPSREMIVTLQSFDRLKQEFEALGSALSQYAAAIGPDRLDAVALTELEQSVIAAITVGDLKERFRRRFQDGLPEVTAPSISEQRLDEIGVDVIY
jgi:hypothetical protein